MRCGALAISLTVSLNGCSPDDATTAADSAEPATSEWSLTEHYAALSRGASAPPRFALPEGFALPGDAGGYLSAASHGLRVAARPKLELSNAKTVELDGIGRGFSGQSVAWLLASTPHGVEDFVRVAAPTTEPGEGGLREALSYELRLDGVAGLRLVANVLEFLDPGGAPRLRMRAPFAIDAAGERWPLRLSLKKCHADMETAPPWGRPVTPAGGEACEVSLSVDVAARFPLWVDPEWHDTSALAVPRSRMARIVGSGPVLAIGGLDSSGQALASVERFDPSTNTWAMTGELAAPRTGGELLQDAAGTRLLVAEGVAETERYSEADGTWSAGPAFPGSPGCALQTPSGRIYQIGVASDRLQAAELSTDGSEWLPIAATNTPAARFRAGCGLLGDRPLVLGGVDAVGDPQLSSWFLDLQGGVWEAGPEIDGVFPRGVIEPSFVANLVVGGEVDGAPSSASLSLVEIASQWQVQRGPSLPVAVSHAATLIDSDSNVWLFGGRQADGSASDQVLSLFAANPVEGWVTRPPLPTARQDLLAGLLDGDRFLLSGGEAAGSPVAASEIYEPAPAACVEDADCFGGFCVAGRCCASACDGTCEACAEALTGRPDGECAPVLAGLDSGGACPTDPDLACGLDGTCDGNGQCRLAQTDVRCGGACLGDQVRADHCDGVGGCVEGPIESCSGYTCREGACVAACGLGSYDCADGYRCALDGTCQFDPPEPRCGDCNGYACSPAGKCLTSCNTTSECSWFHNCSEAHTCDPIELIPDLNLQLGHSTCGCKLAGAGGGASRAVWLPLLPLLWWTRRARSRRALRR